MTTPFRLSASKLKRYLQCPRSYFLRYVARVPEDFGGKFLEVGDAYDRHVQWYLSSGARGVQSIDPKIVKMFDAARPLLPAPGAAEVQREYRFEHADGFIVEGKPDIRRPCRVGDTKTTADRGPGLGRDRDRAPIALDAQTLHHDPQPLLYAWCEFQLDPAAQSCVLEWVYVSKESKPTAWVARTTVTRAEVVGWFERVVRPAAAEMAKLHAEYDAMAVRAELDACDEPKCWVRAHCTPFDGPNSYDGLDLGPPLVQLKRTRPVSPAKPKEEFVAFDLRKLSEEQVDLTEALAASLRPDGSPTLTALAVRALREEPGSALAETLNPAIVTDGYEAPTVAVWDGEQAIPINPPSPAEARLHAAIAECRSAAERAERLLAEIRGGGR